MTDCTIMDTKGNKIRYLTQWDANQKIIVELPQNISIAPEVHFCNKHSRKALIVQSTLSGNKITVDVPNILLEEPYVIYVYIYLIDDNSGKTVKSTVIPVRKRAKPDDYEYVENVEVIYLTDLINKVNLLNDNLESAEAIRVENENIRNENEIQRQQNIGIYIEDYLKENPITDSSVKEWAKKELGSGLIVSEDGRLSVDTVNAVEENNMKPITSDAVYAVLGNVEALLSML